MSRRVRRRRAPLWLLIAARKRLRDNVNSDIVVTSGTYRRRAVQKRLRGNVKSDTELATGLGKRVPTVRKRLRDNVNSDISTVMMAWLVADSRAKATPR